MDDNALSEQLEEGEIVDDDDFEDISDNSIIELPFGKFVSSNENLRALSLSSDSDLEKNYIKKRKVLHRKSRPKRRKKIKVPTDSSDSDSPSSVSDLKGKLKEAIRIDDTEGVKKNPLEARLKAMGDLVAVESANSPPEIEAPKELEKTYDSELENLRMEALRTAVLNKCQRRKRKKQLEGQTVENKENNTPEAKKEPDASAQVADLDEDEDLLRASLLAGLAKKISKQEPVAKEVKLTPKLPTTILPKRPINKYKKMITNKKIVNKRTINQATKVINVPKPQVKPLIINVNADSDSDEEIKKSVTQEPVPVAPPKESPAPPKPQFPDLTALNNNVDRFLKEQREKFETEKQKKSILEKSAVKLLPKSQQIEYQLLLRRLRNAEIRKKVQKLAPCKNTGIEKKVEVAKASNVEISVVPPVQIEITTKSAELDLNSSFEGTKDSDSSEKKKTGITTELTTLKETLKEIKMQRNGSLQIKSKYQVLTPIIRKITETSNERKKQEQRIKTLVQELTESRKNLAKSHERFSALVRELVGKKEKIDKSCQEPAKKAEVVTSTPVKAHEIEEPTVSTLMATNNEIEDMDVCNSDETDIGQIDIVDPNDIDQIFKRKMPVVKSTIPEYVSPLNFNNVYGRYNNVDPLGIMCPYEVNGSCRDTDCTYKHYLKRNGEKP